MAALAAAYEHRAAARVEVEFGEIERKDELVGAASGSVNVAQMLCHINASKRQVIAAVEPRDHSAPFMGDRRDVVGLGQLFGGHQPGADRIAGARVAYGAAVGERTGRDDQ